MRGVGEVSGLEPLVPVQAPAVPAAREHDGDIDLAALGRALWEKRRWILAPTLVALALTFVAVNLMTPIYRAETRILIENGENAFFRPEIERNATVDRALVDPEAVTSQVQILLSRDLGRQVIAELHLADKPEFDARSPVSNLLRLVGLGRDDTLAVEERVLRAYFERLKVYPIDKSRVIAIEFESRDPDLAAKVANAVAEAYLALQQVAKQDSTRQASNWLQGEIEKLRKKVAEAEGRADAFRSRADLFVGVNNTQLFNQQLAELNTQLGVARAQKAEAESKARMIRELLAAGRPIETSDIINSELIRRLAEQRVTLKALLAEQSSTLLDQHPRIKELRAQIAGLDRQIRDEAERMVRAFENDARIAEARQAQLTGELDRLKQQVAGAGEQDVQLRALEREAKAERDLLESYLARYRDSAARDTLAALPPDARIISRAMPSNVPAFPKKVPMIVLITLATLVLSTGIVASGELLSGRARHMAVRERGVPVALNLQQAAPADEPAEEPTRGPGLAELVSAHEPGMVAVVPASETVAAAPTAIRLARDLALRGGRTVLIELDPRAAAPSLVRDPTASGVVNLVRGTASFGQVIHRDRASRLHVVPFGGPAAEIEELLKADRLALALSALVQTYDHVVLVAPPAATLAKAGFVGQLPLAVVVGPKVWEPAEAEGVYDQLAEVGIADLIAVVETDVAGAGPGSGDPVMAA
ncbi:GumC family protein [Blastochloris tepida]|uniref:LPS biosynthesis protein n=1 Tax=Blastochloris tepida TaxID=2233851 RepID=A0A348G1A1_9HYPH|nr:exopolysaccharide transport family protein [Blastochloris tepida]BBF93334.1 LPS biosynthesis protein [Blastochloris tepida]